ncbi:motile sperm domain-containing protein 2-like isoform X2 [Dreissena polymorpha]|uniref:motile sperm domain-containing protein 2-like isoform X2 n=1 Tax=Dreissena polymorpha TaxID=45954 RepID=UPI0022649953|nr:motile sperm domain-containing protein 2-like isoform X2 [Dreissena polymorpha]
MALNGSNQDIKEKVQQLRSLFLSKHSANLDSGTYDQRDVDKFKTNDQYVATFIRSYETPQDGCEHVHESLKFRREIGLNDLTPQSFSTELWELGEAFFHNHDKDGNAILYIDVKKHRRDAKLLPTLKKCFAFMLETHTKQFPGVKLCVLLDLAGSGVSNLDMDFIRFIINSFKSYFPSLLEYLLLYEMQWFFNAAWKIVKQMLNAEYVKRIKFVTKADIQGYIDKDQLWEHMGGTDKYVYSYEPEMFEAGSGGDPDQPDAERKRVTFANSNDSSVYRSTSMDSIKDSASKMNVNNSGAGIMKSPRGPPSRTPSRVSREDNSYRGKLLTICPAEEVEFAVEEEGGEACDNIILKNTHTHDVAFKVKTTSPEKYRVRPSSGYIKPGSETEVSVHLQQGYQNTVHKDKFLVMALEVQTESSKTFADLWKATPKDSIMEHRLRCVLVQGKDSSTQATGVTAGQKAPLLSELAVKVDTLLLTTKRLQRNVQYLVVSQLFLILLLVALFVYWKMYTEQESGVNREDSQTQQCLKMVPQCQNS